MIIKKSKFIGQNKGNKMRIGESFTIKGLQSFENHDETLNPVDININTNEFWSFMQKYINKGYVHKFVLHGIDFSLSITKNTNQVFVTCSGLNDAKKYCKNGKKAKELAIHYLEEIQKWFSVERRLHWVAVCFIGSKN